VNYWQTLGILILSKILFTGLSHHRRESTPWKNRSWRHDHPGNYWKKKFEEKMNGKIGNSEKQGDKDAAEGE